MSAMDTELTSEQVAAARALARQAIKDGILKKLREEYYNTMLVPQIDAWLKEIAQQRNLDAIPHAETQLRENAPAGMSGHGGTMSAMDTGMAVAIVAGGAAFMLGAWLVDRRRNGQQ